MFEAGAIAQTTCVAPTASGHFWNAYIPLSVVVPEGLVRHAHVAQGCHTFRLPRIEGPSIRLSRETAVGAVRTKSTGAMLGSRANWKRSRIHRQEVEL
jgi:hypothetical protein